MRLINTEGGKFEEFIDSSKAPLYAILSHTWEQPPGREQSYQDVVKIQEKCGLLEEEAPSDMHSNNAGSIPQTLEVFNGSGLHMSTYSTKHNTQLSHLSPSMLVLLKSLLIAILARASLYFLLGSSIPPFPNPRKEVEPSPSPSSTRLSIWDSGSGLSEKIRNACRIAREDGFLYIWVDSCCIDKTSSTELSEAINSMFNWYRDAQICYAFLSDVPSNDEVRAKGLDLPESSRPRLAGRRGQLGPGEDSVAAEIDSIKSWVNFSDRRREERAKDSKFRKSRWFKRSWTLQELIAPRVVIFLSREWRGLGTKHSLAELIEEITHIDHNILTHTKAVADESVAERMRWAASREATRVEDEAYSLLGIFGITLTTVYGEGRRAFQRLQEEILQRIPDRSLFAWCNCTNKRPIHVSQETNSQTHVSGPVISPFATSPKSFANEGGKINALSEQDFDMPLQLPIEEYTLTPHGIRAKMRLIPMQSLAPAFRITYSTDDEHRYSSSVVSWYLAILGSQHADSGEIPNYLLGKLCCIAPAKYSTQLLEVTSDHYSSTLIWISFDLDVPSLLEGSIDVYLPRPTPSIAKRQRVGGSSNISQSTTASFSPWGPSSMPPGYTISESSLHPDEDRCLSGPHDYPSLSLLLSNNESVNLLIQYRHIYYTEEQLGTMKSHCFIEARIWILSSNATLDSTPPYSSAVWGAGEQEPTLPIWYIPVPVTQSGEDTWITLRLWLGISKSSHYHVHVEVVKDGDHHPHVEVVAAAVHQYTHTKLAVVNSNYCTAEYRYQQFTTRPRLVSPYNDALLGIPEPHPNFTFTLLGSAKRELEAQGYSVHLEAADGSLGNSHSHSHSLIISDSDVSPTFTISVKYFHNRDTRPGEQFPQFIFVACVTLEFIPDHGSERYQDGPYVLNWADEPRWSSVYRERSPIYLTTPMGNVLALDLGLDRAWVSEYYLVVRVEVAQKGDSSSQIGGIDHNYGDLRCRLVDPHDHISLTLPTHTRRALQMHGYEVGFEGSKDNPYHLIISKGNLTIKIEYSHHRPTSSDGQQGLKFQACITTSVSQSSQDAAAQRECQTVNWDTWQHESCNLFGVPEHRGWSWKLSDEDVKLALPNAVELTLRLSLYLLWLSEYCITVEVVPPTSLLHRSRNDSLRSSAKTGMETWTSVFGGDAATQETTAGEADEEFGDSDVVVGPVALPMPGVEDAKVEGADSSERVG